MTIDRPTIGKYCIIVALAFVFAYFGIDKFFHPTLWQGFMPAWIDGLLGMPVKTWLFVFGAIEIILAVLILVPHRRVRQAGALLIVLHLMGVLWQVGWNDIGVRDLGLMLCSAGLFFLA